MKRWIGGVSMVHTIERVAAAWDSCSASQRVSGMEWYFNEHRWCSWLARKANIGKDAACGIVAALSPGTRWEVNQRDAKKFLGLIETPHKLSTYGPQVRKAESILGGESAISVLSGPKERAFYSCLRYPDFTRAICIDRHSGRVALGWELSPHKIGRMLGRVGVFEHVAEAHRVVARLIGIRPHQLQAATWLWYKERS